MKRRITKTRLPGIAPGVLMDYSRWMAKHSEELSRKYPHKFVAVYRGKLVAVGDTYKEVRDAAQQKGIEEPFLAAQVPSVEDVEAIL